jgi:transcriptional regulator with XRE-family HTH domain
MSDNSVIAERLAKLIKEVGINKSQFARAIGINVAYAHQILSGNRVITEKTFSKIKLGIPALNLDYIRTGQGNPLVSNLDLTTLKDRSKKVKAKDELEPTKVPVPVQPNIRFIPLVSTYTCADFWRVGLPTWSSCRFSVIAKALSWPSGWRATTWPNA